MTGPASTPEPPYYAVIFVSRRDPQPDDGYAEMAEQMFERAAQQPGFLGYDTADGDGLGMTVSYWTTESAIAAWKADTDHLVAQQHGRQRWYASFEMRVARVERAYSFKRSTS
jgi:heme-degrading monooxygenase HmoA